MVSLRSRMTLSCARTLIAPINRQPVVPRTIRLRPAWGKFTRISYSKTAISQGTTRICRKDDARCATNGERKPPREMPNEIQIAGPDKRVQDRCVYGEIGVRHSSVLSVPLLGDFGELSRTGIRGWFIVPIHGTRVVGAFPESGRGQLIHVGSDNLCPTPRFTLNARQKKYSL